jgi:xylan 1,4-beta-xylosidase
MYDWTAKAVKDFCPELKVGGPSLTGNTIFLREFLSHCKTGTNYADGSVGAPLDFFSFHIYSNSPERVPCMENMLGRLMELKTLMDKYWGQDIPWLLTEWGVTWGGGRTVDTFPVAHRNANRASTFTLKIIKEMRNFPIEIALFWGFSEWAWKKRQDDSFDFSGQRSILTYSCIERPVAGAYRLLNQLEGEWCHVHRMTDTNNVDALCALKDRELKIVFWNHDPDSYGNAYPTRSELIVNNLPCTTGKVNLKIEGYTLEHNTYQAWQDAGSPPAPTKNQVEDIQKYSIPKLLRNTEIEYKNDIFSTGEMKIKPGEYYLLTASW